jgi:hypothetical protein
MNFLVQKVEEKKQFLRTISTTKNIYRERERVCVYLAYRYQLQRNTEWIVIGIMNDNSVEEITVAQLNVVYYNPTTNNGITIFAADCTRCTGDPLSEDMSEELQRR